MQLDPDARIDFRIAVPAHVVEPVHDIGFDLARLHRFEMMRRDHALAKLFELVRMREQLLELGLAEQQRLQQRVRAELEVGQHAQLFERADREVLSLVDDQQRATAVARFLVQEQFDRRQIGGLVATRHIEPEAARSDVDHLFAVERAGDDFAHGQAFVVELLFQVRDQRRLARADLAGNHDEAFALVQTIAEIAQRLLVRNALEVERRVGRKLEGPLAEAVEFFVHLRDPIRNRSAGRARPMRW